MHSLLFDLKRAYQASTRTLNPLFGGVQEGLTQARYRVLYAINRKLSLLQSELRRALGVSAATISKMVRRLVELGVVERWPHRDRRQHQLLLTHTGRDWLRRAQAALEATIACSVMDAVCPNPMYGPCDRMEEDPVQMEMVELEEWLYRLRRAYGDTATLRMHPGWHPDD